jgi:hypothetical protein
MDEREEVHRDQRIDREVGQFRQRREVAPRGGGRHEEQVADDGERQSRADRPPRDPLGPDALRRPPAEGRRAERHRVEEHQVVHQELDGGMRSAGHPGGEQGARSHGAENEQPIAPPRGSTVTCHGGTRR